MLFYSLALLLGAGAQAPISSERACGELCELVRVSDAVDLDEMDQVRKIRDALYWRTGEEVRPYIICQRDYFITRPISGKASDNRFDQRLQAAFEDCANLRVKANAAIEKLMRSRFPGRSDKQLEPLVITLRSGLVLASIPRAFDDPETAKAFKKYIERPVNSAGGNKALPNRR